MPYPLLRIPLLWFALIATGIYASAIFLVSSAYFLQSPAALSFGITADLVMIVPLAYYFLVIRPYKLPKISVLPVFLLSTVAASFVLPQNGQQYLSMLGYIAAPLELFLVGYILVQVRKTIRVYRIEQSRELDFYETLLLSLRKTFGDFRAIEILASEIAMFHFALSGWRRQPFAGEGETHFSYYRENSYGAVLGAIMFLLLIETVGLHLFIQGWSETIAWIITGLSIYSIFWLLGDFNAMRQRPIVVADKEMLLRIGLRWTTRFPLKEIASIKRIPELPEKHPLLLNAVVFGEPQLLLTLKTPVLVKGFFGIRKTVDEIALSIDQQQKFIHLVQENSGIDA